MEFSGGVLLAAGGQDERLVEATGAVALVQQTVGSEVPGWGCAGAGLRLVVAAVA